MNIIHDYGHNTNNFSTDLGIIPSIYRHRSSVNIEKGEARHFCPKIYVWKFPDKIFFPNLGGQMPHCPISYAHVGINQWKSVIHQRIWFTDNHYLINMSSWSIIIIIITHLCFSSSLVPAASVSEAAAAARLLPGRRVATCTARCAGACPDIYASSSSTSSAT